MFNSLVCLTKTNYIFPIPRTKRLLMSSDFGVSRWKHVNKCQFTCTYFLGLQQNLDFQQVLLHILSKLKRVLNLISL